MQRRMLLTLLAASTPAASAVIGQAQAAAYTTGDQQGTDGDTLRQALQRFVALPGTKSYLIHIGPGGSLGQIAHRPDLSLFTASTYKTFVLGQYLRDVEAGLLSEDEQVRIDDSVRDLASPVFLKLAGTTTARSVLEAMITHSDNTATDLATEAVGADRVRALITEAGLKSIRIPDSTRRFYSYVLGAPTGVDLGWPGIEQANQKPPGALRPALNDVITLAGNARDFVSWYEQALGGDFFTKPETLTEFKRIQAMGMPGTAPPNTAAYGKGGDFPFNGFNSTCLAGQMLVCGERPTSVTFCFTVNWNAPDSEAPAVAAEFLAAISGILGVINAVQMRK